MKIARKSVYPFSRNIANRDLRENIEKETLYPKG